MTFQKRIFSTVLAISLLFSLETNAKVVKAVTTRSPAQFEDLPPPPVEDFSAPAVSPAFTPDGAAPSPTGTTGVPAGTPPSRTRRGETIIGPAARAGGKPGILTKDQKDKFARANPEDINGENFPETDRKSVV